MTDPKPTPTPRPRAPRKRAAVAGAPEQSITPTAAETAAAATLPRATDAPISVEQLDAMISGMALLRRAPKAREIADAAAFLASDRASGMTTGIANVTCGLVTG